MSSFIFDLKIKNDIVKRYNGVLCNGSTNALGAFSQSSNLCTPTLSKAKCGCRISVLP